MVAEKHWRIFAEKRWRIYVRKLTPLQANGLRVSILGGNVDPRKREEWIAKRVNTIDALICNPRLVETGLDLVQFSTVVFFEIEYSLVRRMTA